MEDLHRNNSKIMESIEHELHGQRREKHSEDRFGDHQSGFVKVFGEAVDVQEDEHVDGTDKKHNADDNGTRKE